MTLVKKTFGIFVAAFVIQIAVVALLVGLGYRQSEVQWRQVRTNQAYEAAQALLTGSNEDFTTYYNGPLAVYDTKRELLAGTRGMMGMHGNMGRNMMSQLEPVYSGDVLLGYYMTAEQSFSSDVANRTLLRTMLLVMVVSLLLSLAIALVAALYFSKKVSRPADNMAQSLHLMAEGEIHIPVEPEGSDELVGIATSIESLRQRLVHERTSRAQWSQDIAHDLRTPVASVKAQLEGMMDGILKPEIPRFERTLRELQRMELLIDDLEILMRLESPEAKATRTRIDSTTFIRELKERFEANLLQPQMEIESEIGCEWFFGDEKLMVRALSNLISNALRYGERGTSIVVRIVEGNGSVIISVANQGTVIPQEELPKLTERLYRGEFSRSTQGSGLGLTIVDRIVRLHGGQLEIASDAQQGTRVSMVFPKRQSTIPDSQ
jgi:two-component system sensor histidine kinase BaeS